MRAEEKELSYEELIAWLTLKLIPGLGNRSILRLIRHFGSPSATLKAAPETLSNVPGLREHACRALQARKTVRPPEEEWNTLEKNGIWLLSLDHPDYPSNLKAIPDPPSVLFVRGTIEPRDLVSIAVVGSRAASSAGIAFTEQLCADLARQGVTVVSGFAIGIDSAAHRGALKANGRTLAVLGCGLDIDYPRENGRLREEIVRSGALVTEFPLETLPAAGHFPMRNRIISGLALGVVVVEAAERSGSLITARLALEQGREVFAVPGPARHYRSTGPHRLLKQGAKLVESAEDILEEIRHLIRPSWAPSGQPSASTTVIRPVPEMTSEETDIWKVLDDQPRHIDEICRALQWPVSKVMAVLLTLELKEIVRQLPGKYFTRKS